MLYETQPSTGTTILKRLALIWILAISLLTSLLPVTSRAEELIMVEEDGCIWCARWNAEIAPIYPKTPEGKFAPLRRVDIHAPLPVDLQFRSTPFYTPTFILVRDGQELDRIEGYPGEAFFWGLLGRMLLEHTAFKGAS
jgi:hypothetical protein